MRSVRLSGRAFPHIVVGVTFLALLISAGLRSAPGVMMVPLELHFGWDRATISFSAAVGIFLYGLVGPFAAALMQSVGIKRTMLGGLVIMSAATLASLWMTAPWHYVLTWGVLSGIGSGAVASVLGAAVVNRWFATRQGLVMGMLSASTATGALVFLPVLAWLSSAGAWRPVVVAVSIGCAALIPLVLLFMPEHPGDVGTRRFGETDATAPPPPMKQAATPMLAFDALFRAARAPIFWLLFGTFFVCGLTTNGLVGTHMIAFCGDHGIAPVAAAGLLSLMGLFDLFGTTASGWLTDRYDPAQAALRLLRPARPVPHRAAVHRFRRGQPDGVRGLLWAGLDRDRAADGEARQHLVRRARCADHLRLGDGRAPARRRDGGVRGRGDPGRDRDLSAGFPDRRDRPGRPA
jgi:MFS family permease